jgi:hypothetical protein
MTTKPAIRARLLPLAALLLAGCLGEPKIEDRWTRLDVFEPPAVAPVAPGTAHLDLRGQVIYRSVMTGFIVAEIRVSDTVPYGSVDFDPERDRVQIMDDVNLVLQNSTSAGFTALPFAGWDHLIQDVELAIDLPVPPPPAGGGVYLLFYLADGEEEELPTGEEILVITPFDFPGREVLPVGVELVPE